MKPTLIVLLLSTTLFSQTMPSINSTFESLSPNMIVDDVNLTIDYYINNFGFIAVATVPDSGKFNWGMVQAGNVTLMFQTLKSLQEDMPELKIQAKGSIGTFFIKVKGIESLYAKVKSKVEIAHDMRTTFYGMKEFTIKDVNGYFLTFAEEVK